MYLFICLFYGPFCLFRCACGRLGFFLFHFFFLLFICPLITVSRTSKKLSTHFSVSVRETKTQLPLSTLKKVWGEAVSYICGLREDYSRLFQGQRAAMYVHYITMLINVYNLCFGTLGALLIIQCYICVCRLSLLRYNTNLTKFKNMMFSFSQQLKAKLDFFKSSIQYDLEKYSDQMQYGICMFLCAQCF